MAAIPSEDVNKAFAVNSEDAEKKIRAIDTEDPLKKIGSSTNDSGRVNIEELNRFVRETSSISLPTSNQATPVIRSKSRLKAVQDKSSIVPVEEFSLERFGITRNEQEATNQTPAQEKPSNEPSFLDNVLDVGTAISEGAQQTLNRIGATGGAYTGNERVVVESAKYAKQLEDESEAVRLKEFKDSLSKIKKIDEEEAGLIDSVFYYVGEVAKTAYDNPAGTIQFVAEQLPNAATVLGTGFAGFKAGAAAGTVVAPGLGTAVGGTLGFIAGMFGGNALIETGAKAQEKAADGTFTDQERSEAIKEGAVKAGVVTAVDTATLGASKWILGAGSRAVEKATVKTLERFNINASAATKSIETATKEAADAAKASGLSATQTRVNVAEAAQKAAKDSGLLDPAVIRAVKGAQEKAYTATNRLYNRLPRNTAPLALETIGEGAGEYLGELAATGEADILDAVIESLAGTAQSVTELGAVASSATADGKTTRATMNAIVNEERRIEQQQEQDGQRRSEEDKQRQDTVSDLVSNAIDVEKTLSSTEGIKFLVALHNNNSSDGETSNLIKNAAMKAGVGSQFESNLENKAFIEDGQQIISDSPTFAREFMTALNKYVFDPPADTKPKMPTGRVNERQVNNQMDEDLMAQEQSGQLFTSPPTDVNVTEQPSDQPQPSGIRLRRIDNNEAAAQGDAPEPSRKKPTAAELPAAVATVMRSLVTEGVTSFQDVSNRVTERLRNSEMWRDLEPELTPELMTQAYNNLPDFDGKEVAAPKPDLTTTQTTTQQATPPQESAQTRQAMTLRDIGLAQQQEPNVQTADSAREIEDIRSRGSIEAIADGNFPTARLDKTLKRAEKEPEAMQAARTFVEASEKRSAAEKKLNDAIANNANPVERARLTQDAVKAREDYNQAIQNIDQVDQAETPTSFQEKGRPEPKSRAKTLEQVKEDVKTNNQRVFDLIASGNLWEAMDEWKSNALALQRINSQIYLLRQLIDAIGVEILNAETLIAGQKEIDQLTEERKALRKELNEANHQVFMSQFIFSDMVARELNKNPNNPHAKILGDYVAAAQRKKELVEGTWKKGKTFPKSEHPTSYLEALMMNDPFRVTIRAIIADIYNSNETNHAEAVKSRLDNFDFWVEQASKEYALQGTRNKPFTDAQKKYLKTLMKSKYATVPNILASFHSYKNQKDGNYTTDAGAELSKRLDDIINSVKRPQSVNEEAYRQIAILERILDGTATPEEKAQYGHLGGYAMRDANADSPYQDPSTAQETVSTPSQDAAAIIKELREGVRGFNEDILGKYDNLQEAIRQLENIDAQNKEAAWNMLREQTFHKMQIEYRKAIDAGLNPVEAGQLFNEAVRRFGLIYTYKPDVGMVSSTSRYDPVLAQLFGDMSVKMFPETNGTLDDLAENVRQEIMESLNEVEQQSPQQILTRLIDELKSNKVDAAYAAKFVNDLLRNKELNLGDIIQSLKAAGVERPVYLASLTSHISLRYSMDYWVSKNGGGQQYADQWLADHHSLNIVQRFKDIKVRDENGVEVQQEDLLELADNEAQAYKEWLDARRDDLEAQNLDIDPDATATSDVLQRFSFYKYTLDTLPEGNSTELINAWHRDIEYALRKYPHLRSEIISTDQGSNALVKGQDALAHREWIAKIKQNIKQANAKFEGNLKAKAVIADLLERGEITEAEYDTYYDKIAIADANEYQAIIDNVIKLANNTGRRDRNRRVKAKASESVSEDRPLSEYEKVLEKIKQEDLLKSKALAEFEETGVIVDDSVDQLVLDDPSRFTSDMTEDEMNDVFDAYAAEGGDPYIIEEVGESDLDYVDPNTDARLRQGPYSGVFTAAQTQTWVNNLIGDWNAAPKVHVVSRPSLLPEPVRTRILGKIGANTGAKGAFDTTDGSVYVFSDYVTSEADLEFTVFHEVAGHLGLRGLLGNRLDSFLETAYRTNEKIREMADAMMSKEGITRLEAVEEILSDANTSSEVPSLVTNFVGLVITGLRRIGFNKVADWLAFVTTAEVQYTLNAAKRWAKNGDMKSYNGAPDTIRLSTTPSPYEMFAMKRGKLSGYARYNPLTDEWYVFTSMSGDIRDIANSHARVIADMADVRAELSKFGKIEERKRSSYFRDNKVPVNFMTFPNLMEGSALQSYRNKFVQYVQNEYLPVWKLMDHLDKAGRLSKVMDLRTDLSLYERKTGALVERFTKTYVKQIQFLLEKAGKKGATSEFVNNVMVAYHAEERNKEILHTQLKALYFSNSKLQKETKLVDGNGEPLTSDHQFTFKEYETILKTFKRLKKAKDPAVKADSVNETGSGMGPDKINKPDGTVIPGYKEIFDELNKSDFAQELREVSELLDKLGDARVDYMVQTGLVSSLDGAKMKSYRHYRNLSGINSDLDNDPTTDPMLDRTGRKFNAAKAKEKRALGRGDIAPDVIARTLAAFESTIIRGQKNLVAQKVLMVFEHNYDPNFIVINEIAKKQKVGPDGVVRIVDDENYLADPSVMVARVGGIPVTMKFKQTGYGSVGEALHGMIYPPQMNDFLYVVGRLNRVIGQLLTTWNPLWVPVNFVRDIQTLYSNAASDGRISRSAARQMFKTTFPAMYTSVYANILDSQPVTEKGKLAKKALLSIFPQPRADLLASYKEAKFAGGLTSFIDRKGLEEQMIELDRVLNGSFKRPGIGGAAVGAIDWTVAKVEGLGKALEFFTIPFEYGPRLAAYHVAKSNKVGMNKSDAAVFSGEITVNFNMRGSTKSLRQLFLFFNPAVQGTAKIVDLAKKDKVKFGELALSWIAFGALMNLVGRALSGEDENGENKIDGLPIYKRSTAAVWMADMPGGAIPIAYGWNFFYSVGTFAMDSIVADVPVSTSAKRIAATGFEAFSPIGLGIADASTAGTAVAKTLSPQVILPLTEYVLNENRFGAPIRMDDSFTDEEKPDTQMAFSSVHPLSKFATDKLHQLTGGNRWTSDGIDINPALIDQMISGYLPGAIDTAYKELGRYMRQSSGLDVDEGKPNPVVARFTAYRPEMMDAAIFRDALTKVSSITKELSGLPQNNERRAELQEKYPKVGEVKVHLDAAKQYIRNISAQINRLSDEVEQKRIEGTLTKEDERRLIEAQNIRRREQLAVYKRTTKMLVDNGFRDLVISRD